MKTRKLDENHDYSFGNNLGDYISGIDAVVQNTDTKIRLYYGEWWEDISIGIPMFQSIVGEFDQNALQTSASLLLERRALDVQEVSAVQNVKVLFGDNAIGFKMLLDTDYGAAELEVKT